MQQKKNNYRHLTVQQQEDLIKEYSWFIKIIARAVKRKMLLDVMYEEDLFSLGVIGLLDAAKRYDPSHGTKFRTYAKLRIFGEMIDDIRKTSWVPRSVIKIQTCIQAKYSV